MGLIYKLSIYNHFGHFGRGLLTRQGEIVSFIATHRWQAVGDLPVAAFESFL